MIYLFWGISLVFLYTFMKYRQKKRIGQLVDLIEKLNKQNYSIPMKQDDFSILEDQIYKLFLQIVEEKEEVKKLSAKQTQNLENIAHQIKTPITTMLFDLEILEEEENKSQEIKKLNFQLNRLNALSDILLKLASLDVQADKMKGEKIYVEELFDYVLDVLDKDIFRRGIEITKDYKEAYIFADFYWMGEALINIIKNSIQRKDCRNIKIIVEENLIFTQFSIEDDGGGIKIEDKKKIFERFYKTPDSNGFGIGLAMAKTIIENNNGKIRVQNGKRGAIFQIKLYKLK